MINLLYAGNAKIFDGLLISLYSLAQNTKQPFTAYVLTMDLKELDPAYIPISDRQIEVLQNVITKFNNQNKIIKVDTTKLYHQVFDDGKNTDIPRCTPYTLLRLLAPKLNLPSKIIYLDVDTIVNHDIEELFNIDITNFEVGAVRDILFVNFVGFFNYFNAGVLLLNLDKIKQTKSFDIAIDIYKAKKLSFADQDALNKVIKYRRMIPYKFNWFRHKCKYNTNIVVHHLCNARQKGNTRRRIKPWQTELFLQSFPIYTSLINDCLKIKKEANL
jgi:lipopolysaccharide biosynthesis glycosyltransferase